MMLSVAPDNNSNSLTNSRRLKMTGNATWFEIPTTNFERAIKFYEAAFQVTLKREDMGGPNGQLAIFPGDETVTNGALVEPQPGYEPSKTGAAIYLNGGDNLQDVLDRALKAGGKVIVPKTALPPGMGHFAHFQDSEGNRVGLHSMG
jgi:uncharacterized protein